MVLYNNNKIDKSIARIFEKKISNTNEKGHLKYINIKYIKECNQQLYVNTVANLAKIRKFLHNKIYKN